MDPDVMLVSMARRKGNTLQRIVVDTPYFHGFPTRRGKKVVTVLCPSGAIVSVSKRNDAPRTETVNKSRSGLMKAGLERGKPTHTPTLDGETLCRLDGDAVPTNVELKF